MRIIQLTDSHIGRAGETPLGIDVRAHFRQVIESAVSHDPDLIIHTGDICLKEPTEEAYRWTADVLNECGLQDKIIGVPGNHDEVIQFAIMLDLEGQIKYSDQAELYYQYELDTQAYDLILLDSSSKAISTNQLSWFRNALKEYQKPKLILCVHHPPILCSVRYMDQHHRLENGLELMKIIEEYQDLEIDIFCGHYHVEKTIRYSMNINVHITPSSYVQISHDAPGFVLDHSRPGYRVIDLIDDCMMTYVVYID